ncbi:Uncharacterised protein [Chlamydia trachomatis]|nr:Uncharacterised protein [Chlamydia trachomatis]
MSNKTLYFPRKCIIKTTNATKRTNENGNDILFVHQRKRYKTLKRFGYDNRILKPFIFRNVIGNTINNQAALKCVCLTECSNTSWQANHLEIIIG